MTLQERNEEFTAPHLPRVSGDNPNPSKSALTVNAGAKSEGARTPSRATVMHDNSQGSQVATYQPVMTPTLARLHARHKARQARFKQAAANKVEPISTVRQIHVLTDKEIQERKDAKRKQLYSEQLVLKANARFHKEQKKAIEKKLGEEGVCRFIYKLLGKTPKVTTKQIARDVAKKYWCIGVTYSDLYSQRRNKEAVLARHECFYRARMETKLSLPEIAKRFSGKDHTTIMHGIKRYQRLQAGEVPKWIDPALIIDPSIYEVTL